MRLTPSLAVVGSLQFGISGPFDCHVYALRGPSGIVLVDAGAGTHTSRLLDNVRADFGDVPIDTLILTHCHLDHCGGAGAIRSSTGCRVAAPEATRAALESGDEEATGLCAAREQGVYPADVRLAPCPVDLPLVDGLAFEAAGLRFLSIHVRGHSTDSFCLLNDSEIHRWLFSGDALFYGGVMGVINHAGSDMDGYRRDLPKLQNVAVDGLFPGHGLFTLTGARKHIEAALQQLKGNFLPRQIGQGDLLF